ncbi:glycoside hydrolase family 43 protein [Kineococcus rhizosphaerae]|uniref:Alpha-N-arabinofuranosidase n=1 Tax=Kineococcus rhizosphaerae TaxID=559628 RepID=A0A2T0QP79_9ACTN|nr:glycoside hydrolase family 43 protein [Kineococcus rhizosphaerae]PRY06441.1 alpha-N-arabinofuranosidase [Kineococcus rhizosphaerae]
MNAHTSSDTGYRNPVVRGVSPDPSVVRVGDDYYLANSTFDLMPGVTIRHSTDLLNWRTIGHAITRPEQYRRDSQDGPVVLFAPTLRHHDGVFYLACTNAVRGQGNFIVRTTDPTGEWSDALWIDDEGFDPSLFRDHDGIWYYTRRTLQFGPEGLGPLVQATIDLETGQLGPLREITAPHGFSSNDIEGPHLFTRDGWYYLCSAEGGSWKGHMQTIARSRSVWGPFEPAPHNPILTHRHRVAHPIQTLGHAELVDAPDGSAWALALGTRHPRMAQHHALGRETFLLPVRWENGWPYVGDGGTTELHVEGTRPPSGPAAAREVPDTLWSRGWKTIGAPAAGLDAAATDARIEMPVGRDPRTSGPGPVGALLLPQTEYDQRLSVTLADLQPGSIAGVAAYADRQHCYALTVAVDATGDRTASLSRTVDDFNTLETVLLPSEGVLTLSVDAHETSYTFVVRAGHQKSHEFAGLGARLLSAETAQWFTNVSFALLALEAPKQETGERGVTITFADVTVVDLEPGRPASPVPF